jgi:hypothetical protein
MTDRVQTQERPEADRRFQILILDQLTETTTPHGQQHEKQQQRHLIEHPDQIRLLDQHGHRPVLAHPQEHDQDQPQVAPEAVAAVVVLEEEIKNGVIQTLEH